MNNKDLAYVFGVVILCIALLCLGPVLLIWSVNVLFGTQTPLNLTTFVAALVFMSLMRVSVSSSRK